jgi:hypothetical protein
MYDDKADKETCDRYQEIDGYASLRAL